MLPRPMQLVNGPVVCFSRRKSAQAYATPTDPWQSLGTRPAVGDADHALPDAAQTLHRDAHKLSQFVDKPVPGGCADQLLRIPSAAALG